MKYLTIVFLLLFAWQSSAQVMVIHRSGLPDTSIGIADIAKITFDLSGTTGIPHTVAFKKMNAIMAKILPNPLFTKIEYSLNKAAIVKIRVFDLQGKIVRTLNNSKMDIGHYTTTWNSCNESGLRVGKGPYIVNIEINDKSISKSLFILIFYSLLARIGLGGVKNAIYCFLRSKCSGT